MKTLVVFYSRTGSTKKIAQTLAKKIGADVDEIIDHTNRNGFKGILFSCFDVARQKLTNISTKKDPKNYDLVIIATPIWVGTVTPAVLTYATQFKSQIKKYAVITVGDDAPDKAVASLESLLTRKSVAFTGFTATDLSQNYESKLNEFVKKLK
jgi:flavodoxin